MIDFEDVNKKRVDAAVNMIRSINNGFIVSIDELCMFHVMNIFIRFEDAMLSTNETYNSIDEQSVIELYNKIQLYYD